MTRVQLFTEYGFVPRAKGQRYPKNILPTVSVLTATERGYKVATLGSISLRNPLTGLDHAAEALAVTTPDGVVVPAIRLTGGNYVIVQDLSFFPKGN